MSLRARAIQPKSIHNFSTAAALSTTVAVVLVACAGGGPGTTMLRDRKLVADPPETTIAPGATGTARFVLLTSGRVPVPIAGQQVTFSFMNMEDAMGATLAGSSAVTDVSGVATVDVHAGLATTVSVRATSGDLQAAVKVTVALGTASVDVTPFFAPNSSVSNPPTGIDVWMVNNEACADVPLLIPPPRDLPIDPAMLAGAGGTAHFTMIPIMDAHAIAARAVDASNHAIAVGCIDVPAASLLDKALVAIALPLHDAVPDPVGRFAVTSRFTFNPPLAAAARIADTWRDLGDCPLDPAQLLLDCMIDAMSPATDADPLDCRPSPIPGGEGPLADAFAARRGTPILDGTNAPTACRGTSDAAGAPSLDAIAMGLFGTPTPRLLIALPDIATNAAHILDKFDLQSTLTIDAADGPDQYVVTHALGSAGFVSPVDNATKLVTLATLALPALTAYTTATTRDGLLIVDSHGFSGRLGQVARAGFIAAALVPRGVSPDVRALIQALLDVARSADGTMTGCAAFDPTLCAAVGRDAGCLAAACPLGLDALASRLDAAFDAADGTGLDLTLSGSAPLLDQDNPGVAMTLGTAYGQAGSALWSIELRTASGGTRTTVPFDGRRF